MSASGATTAWWRKKIWKFPAYVWAIIVVVIIAAAASSGGSSSDTVAGSDSSSATTEPTEVDEGEAAPSTEVTMAPTTTEPESSLTPSQQQAVRSAESYLDFKGFSRQGLIDQLSSEYGDQFPVEDATIAVDSLNVDWNAEAVRAAQSYLDFKGFSCQGLIDQLSSEYGDQFTVEQATYAAGQVGIC